MSKALPEVRMIEKARNFVASGEGAETPRFSKLLKRIAAGEELWLFSCESLGGLSWACEAMSLGLNREEVTSVAALLASKKLMGIQLNSPEAYKALILVGLQNLRSHRHRELARRRKLIEDSTKTLLRFDRNGIVASGYRRGLPLTTYISAENHYHKVYLDKAGKFQEAKLSNEFRLSPEDQLYISAVTLEKSMLEIRNLWGLWHQERELDQRIENLEKFSDTAGAFA